MSGYTLSALGSSSASAKAFVTEELSPIQSPSAATKFENSGLGLEERGEGLKSEEPHLSDRSRHHILIKTSGGNTVVGFFQRLPICQSAYTFGPSPVQWGRQQISATPPLNASSRSGEHFSRSSARVDPLLSHD
jgi:hypothetical protein